MNNQKKVKLLIAFCLLIVVALATAVVFQLIDISKTKKQLNNQEKQIEQLEQDLDYYKNKLPNSDFDTIS